MARLPRIYVLLAAVPYFHHNGIQAFLTTNTNVVRRKVIVLGNNNILVNDAIENGNTVLSSDVNDATTIQPRKQRVVIIGGGVGGLATAARISSSSISSSSLQQVEVIILEKNSYKYAGGRCGSYNIHIDNVGTFRHERVPSLLLLRQEYIRLFHDCCRDNSEISSRRRETTATTTNTAAVAAAVEDAAKMYGLEMKQCIPAYQVIFDDGDVISLGFPSCVSFNDTVGGLLADANDDERIKKNVQLLEQESIHKFNMLEPNGYQKWCNYLNTCSAYLDCGLPNFIEQNLDLSSFPTFLYESVLNNNAMYWPLQPHSTMVSNIFTSTKVRALATFQDLYVGLEPNANHRQLWDGILRKTAPAVFGLLAAVELHPTNVKSGVFAPIGGFQQVIESMIELCTDLNVEIQYNTSVTRVTTDGVHYIDRTGDNNRDGYLEADLIICNADIPYATETILKPSSSTTTTTTTTTTTNNALTEKETFDWNDKLDYSSGVIAYHWSISQSLTALNTHNIFLSANTTCDMERSWSVLRDDNDNSNKNVSETKQSMIGMPFNFYVHRASKVDSTACPANCDSIMVLGPCPILIRDKRLSYLPRNETIESYKQQCTNDYIDNVRDAVLHRLSVLKGLENIKKFILHEVVDTPGSYADYYNVGAGVPFGLSHGLGQLSLTRPAHECNTHDNVLFVGASSRPGNGVPLVLIGSRQVAKKAVTKLKNMVVEE